MAHNMGLDPGTMMASDQATPSDKTTGSPAQSPASRPKTIGGRGAAYPDGRKDVRFARPSAAVSNLNPKQLNYAGWRYPAGQGGFFSQENTPASSAMPSPAVDAANPMELYPPDSAAYPQYYGYSPYSQYSSYPNTPSIRSAAGYNARSDPFNFEEMAEAVAQPKSSSQISGAASLQDRRKKSWYGPR
ncbi:hypothetical protein NCC49_003150 [Naganishia albida]|nr:hypothetical protein NCC49_003150 [Naganishia albida]